MAAAVAPTGARMGADDFEGTARFEILRRLGAGGMGVIYEARDRVRNMPVALKTLAHVDPTDLYNLKREFRSLIDVTHPNLVTLHELFVEADLCFFTMELVHGVDFLTYVRAASAAPYADTVKAQTPDPSLPARSTASTAFDESRLRACLWQLVSGVCAIHAAGKLHCDLKPSNVLVMPTGRVVILDFGLATEQVMAPHEREDAGGTPEYMAPEQGWRGTTTPASDWYAVGAMLYEAMAGTLPFSGGAGRVLSDKVQRDAPAPPGSDRLPGDLVQLCMELLDRDPSRRPDGDRLLAFLLPAASGGEEVLSVPPQTSGDDALLFVGRGPQLEALRRAHRDLGSETPVVALVLGPSGIGKTALVSRFLGSVADGATLVLRGRCYERESLPFKAFDTVIDSLTRYLVNLPRGELALLLPEDVASLGRVFPVLRRAIEMVRSSSPTEDAEPRAQRRRAFAALKELLRRFTQTTKLLVFIDDLQWGDADSAHLLAELLMPPDAPSWLLVGACRADQGEASPFLATFRREVNPTVEVREVNVGPLDIEEARSLALRLLPSAPGEQLARVDAIAHEAGGSPYFVAELARHQTNGPTAPASGDWQVSLDAALLERIGTIPPSARILLEYCSLAGRPISEDTLIDAAGVSDPYAALARLKSAKLVRGVAGAARALETYHDRVRETVANHVAPEHATRCHHRLALSLEKTGGSDLEVLAEHFRRAGEPLRARRYAIAAAKGAADSLAFDHAARLYRLALDLGPTEPENGTLHERLAETLSSAGRSADAARAFLAIADGASAPHVPELRRRAAEQFLRSGFVDAGMAVLRDGLLEVGIDLPTSDESLRTASRSLSLQLRERGLEAKESSEGLTPALQTRIDVCWSAALGLATIDGARAELMAFHHLLSALDSGDARFVLRGLALHVVTSGARPGSRRVTALLDAADALAQRIGTADARGWASYARGVANFWQGAPRSCYLNIAQAESHWREVPGGRARELSMARMAMHLSLVLVGAIDELRARVPQWLGEAADRDDRYLSAMLRSYQWAECLAADDPERALSEADSAIRLWGRSEFDVLHWEALMTRVHVAIYQGQPMVAWTDLTNAWPRILSSNIGLSTQFRALTFEARARAALALAVRSESPEPFFEQVESDASELLAVGLPCSTPHVPMFRAAVQKMRGNRETATALLAEAERGFTGEEGSPLGAMVVRRVRGELLGGEDGARLVRHADRFLRGTGVKDPVAWTALYAPGFALRQDSK